MLTGVSVADEELSRNYKSEASVFLAQKRSRKIGGCHFFKGGVGKVEKKLLFAGCGEKLLKWEKKEACAGHPQKTATIQAATYKFICADWGSPLPGPG